MEKAPTLSITRWRRCGWAAALIGLVPVPAAPHGAIAVGETGSIGWSYDHPSPSDAEAEALRKCMELTSKCVIEHRFNERCFSIFRHPMTNRVFVSVHGGGREVRRTVTGIRCKLSSETKAACAVVASFCDDPDRKTTPRDYVVIALNREAEHLASQKYTRASGPEIADRLAANGRKNISVELMTGKANAIVAVCDQSCTHIDISLYDTTGNLLMRSDEVSPVAILNGNPEYSGLHRVDVVVPGCKQAECEIGLLVMQQETMTGTRSRPLSVLSRPSAPLTADEEGFLKPEDAFKECGMCPEMVVVPAGEFLMGSPVSEEGRHSDEGPQITAYVTSPFAVGKFEVTRDEYETFVKESRYAVGHGCRIWNEALRAWDLRPAFSFRYPGFRQDGNHPVVCINWDDAKAYVTWLEQKTGKPYRLLSEAEWEYVARAGTTTPFWWGSTISTEQANYDGRSTYGKGKKGQWRQATVPVDSFGPNPWGLYNVHGNVWEWVEDCYLAEWYQSLARATKEDREITQRGCAADAHAFRGGSWVDDPDYLRSARRVWHRPGGRLNYLGFRVARTL